MARKIILTVALAVAACGGSRRGLKLTMIDASVQRPSNVAIYFTVDTAEGEPVPGLTAESFQIFEDDKPVSGAESQQTILNTEVSASHYTLLLIDMSGSVAESDDLPIVVESAQDFAERLQQYQKVSVYAFDGSPDIRAVGDVASLGSFKSRDPSTNLNGAIVGGLKVLERQMKGSSTPLTFGTLVVFTDGSDHAARVTHDKLHRALDDTEVDVLVIGVGTEIDERELRAIGRQGAILSKDRTQIATSFETAAARVEAFSKRFYLLGYCSPARAGRHVVAIETVVEGRRGSLEYEFNAKGFAPKCDPTRQPAFSLKRPKKKKHKEEEVPVGRF